MQSIFLLVPLLLTDSGRLPNLDDETRPKFVAECSTRVIAELQHLVMDCPEPHLARLALGSQTLAMKIRPEELTFEIVFIEEGDDEMSDYRRTVWDEDFLLPDLPKLDHVDDFDHAWALAYEMMQYAGLSDDQCRRLSHLVGNHANMLEMLMHDPSVTAVLRRRVLESFERDYFPLLGEIPEFTYSCMQDLLEEKALERERLAARKLRQQYRKV